ncbi:MAG: efflux RND transporter periplasmic adaptor subunit [Thermoanaerobaculia bacterium]|nr:efflux RND transporter periplasmic adaptor subunit [Thermoanaerobaculia bacterium]
MTLTTNEPNSRGRVKLIVIAVLVALLALGWILAEPIMKWFHIGHGKEQAAAQHDHEAEGAPMSLDDATRASVERMIAEYESVRATLANDTIEGIGDAGEALAKATEDARKVAPPALGDVLGRIAGHAGEIAKAGDIVAARRAFGELGRDLVPLVAMDPALAQSLYLFECPMEQGFNRWIQKTPSMENPYKGQAMLSCGSKIDWKEYTAEMGGEAVAYYTCPMHPSVKQPGPGKCPICGMELTAVTKRDAASGIIVVDSARRQAIGVKTALVGTRALTRSVRVVGRTTYDESRVRDVTLKLSGFVEKLHVNTTGQPVRAGQPLLSIYSPELFAAQKELLLAVQSQRSASGSGAPDRADYLVESAKKRLQLWGFSRGQVDEIARTGKAIERMPVLSPYSGFVIEKNVVEGAAVASGERVFRIAALDVIWVEADVYERDLASVVVGQTARVSFQYLPGEVREGKVAYVYPYLDPGTRTGKIRIELANAKLDLKPEMFADVELESQSGEQLVVPTDSVVDTGPRKLVFLDLGEGRIKPQEIRTGDSNDEWIAVLEGVKEGDRIVTAANFLIAAESRIRSAAESWGGEGAGHAGH